METISLPSTLPAPLQRVHLAHFSNLDAETQSAAIIRRIICASQLPTSSGSGASAEEVEVADTERARLDFAFLDATRLCSKQHVLGAITQAAIVCARSWDADAQGFREGEASMGGMKSKTPHSEIIYMLNPGNNVGESLKRFGLSARSTSLLLVKFSRPEADTQQILQAMIDVVGESNLTVPTSNQQTTLDIDQAIRFARYPEHPSAAQQTVTDWKELNKIYKLGMTSGELGDAQSKHEDIICTSVAMKLVAA